MAKKTNKNENSKLVAILSYFLIGIVWYFVDDKIKKDSFAKFHVKQALNLFVICIAVNILSGIFGFYGLLSALKAVLTILAVIGIVYAIQDKKEPIPLVGNWAKQYLTF